MSNLLQEVEQSIGAHRLLEPGQAVLVAVSGGLDSTVLLHVLHELAPKQGWRLYVAHLNHLLRGRSSNADERLVSQTADRLELELVIQRSDVRQFARTERLSIEMAARLLRHSFLAQAAAEFKASVVALAHHADDQLELFFLRLFRGSGGEGLAGMKWSNPSPSAENIRLVRPLLAQPKAALREFARARKIRFREDASNAVLEIQRNRIRHELLPLLRNHYQPALDQTVLRAMEIVGAESEFVTHAAKAWLKVMAGNPNRTRIRGPIAPPSQERLQIFFDRLDLAVQRRCLQLQLIELGVVPDYELVETLRLSADRPVQVTRPEQSPAANSAIVYPASVVRIPAGLVQLLPVPVPEFQSASLAVELAAGRGKAEFEGLEIRWQIVRGGGLPLRRPSREEYFDADHVGTPIIVRHWRRGDRYQPIGMKSSLKLQDFFTNEKVERARRHQLVVAQTAAGRLFWVEGLRISDRFKVTKGTIRRLQWCWQRL